MDESYLRLFYLRLYIILGILQNDPAALCPLLADTLLFRGLRSHDMVVHVVQPFSGIWNPYTTENECRMVVSDCCYSISHNGGILLVLAYPWTKTWRSILWSIVSLHRFSIHHYINSYQSWCNCSEAFHLRYGSYNNTSLHRQVEMKPLLDEHSDHSDGSVLETDPNQPPNRRHTSPQPSQHTRPSHNSRSSSNSRPDSNSRRNRSPDSPYGGESQPWKSRQQGPGRWSNARASRMYGDHPLWDSSLFEHPSPV